MISIGFDALPVFFRRSFFLFFYRFSFAGFSFAGLGCFSSFDAFAVSVLVSGFTSFCLETDFGADFCVSFTYLL